MRRQAAVMALIFASTAAFVLVLDRGFQREAVAAPGADRGPLENVLGSSKEMIGDAMFLKADEYYHGGVIEKFHEEAEEAGHEEAEEKPRAAAKPLDWIAAVNARVQSHEHRHLSGDEKKEMLPFFAMSTALDPHNIEAILATAFWLDGDFGKTADAVQVLKKGIADNPAAWQLESQLAGIYADRLKDPRQSHEHYLRAVKKSRAQKIEKYEQVRLHYYLAESYRGEGKASDALFHYKRALSYLESRGASLEKTILRKIAQLEPVRV